MAKKTYDLHIEWENEDSFTMTTQYNSGSVFKVVEMDENLTIALIWPHVGKICRLYFNKIMTEIGTEMKA